MEVTEKLKHNFQLFRQLENELLESPSLKKAENLVSLAMTGLFGIYYSSVLENFYIQYAAQKIILSKDLASVNVEKNSCLHVMTEAYLTGGHTRVVERWIAFSKKGKQSIVLTNQKHLNQIPDLLKEVVGEKQGEIAVLNRKDSVIKKADSLLKMSLSYDVIVLHHHGNDCVPLMAFSNSIFKRPIICFNHSGHTFWLGSTLVDHSIEIEKNQMICSQEKRAVIKQTLLNMPFDFTSITKSNLHNIKSTLRISEGSKIIVSMASMYKYTSVGRLSFINYLREVMLRMPSVVFIGIGVYEDQNEWGKLKEDFSERIFLVGKVSYSQVSNYLKVADLYVDSFPFNSWVSMIDAINYGNCPILTLATPIGHPPFVEGSKSICYSMTELIEKTTKIFLENTYKDELQRELRERFLNECSLDVFSERIETIIKEVKKNKIINKEVREEKNISQVFTDFDRYYFVFKTISSQKKNDKKKLFYITKSIEENVFTKIKTYSVKNVCLYKHTTYLIDKRIAGKIKI